MWAETVLGADHRVVARRSYRRASSRRKNVEAGKAGHVKRVDLHVHEPFSYVCYVAYPPPPPPPPPPLMNKFSKLPVRSPPHSNRGRTVVTRPFLPLRSRLLPLAVLLAAGLSSLSIDDPIVVAQTTPGMIVSPTSLTIPVGSRACYQVSPATVPTGNIVHSPPTQVNNNSGEKVTFLGNPGITDWFTRGHLAGTAEGNANLKIGFASCVRGNTVTSTPVTIVHTFTSSDSNYNGVTSPAVSVTVTAADSKPTVRFLHSEMRVVEGDTGQIRALDRSTRQHVTRDPINVHELNTREITVKLDIAPAPTSDGQITWWIPHPHCRHSAGCKHPYAGDASYNGDYAVEGLIGRQVRYTSGSNNMEFKFYVRSDDADEDDETVKIFLMAYMFQPESGIVGNNAVCVGSCSSPTEAQQSMVFRIIDDDDGSSLRCAYCGKAGELGRIDAPQDFVQTSDDEEEESENQELLTPEDENEQEQEEQETPNRAPTVVHSPGDIAIANEHGSASVSLFTLVDDTSLSTTPVSMFHDADGDDLTITAASSDEAVATVSVSNLTATISAKSRGTATITVTADDSRGGTGSDEFTVTVKSAPTVASAIGDVSGLEAGRTKDISLSGVFSDADGDALSITADSLDDDVASVEAASNGTALTVTGVAEGDTMIVIVAEDSDGNQIVDSFGVSVSASQPVALQPPAQQESQKQQQVPTNRAPTMSSLLSDVKDLEEGGTRDVSLSGVFSDADGDALSITASSDYEDVATVTVASDSSELTLTGGSSGVATITVVAQDPDGDQAVADFDVEVVDAPPQPGAEQQSRPQPPEQEDTPISEPGDATTGASGSPALPQEREEASTSEPESETSDAVDRYDTNGDGSIDLSEYTEAANDYFDGKITYSEMAEIALAYTDSSR